MGYPDRETQYEKALAPARTGQEGPRRFEEGITSDSDVPGQFAVGSGKDVQGDGRGRPYTICKTPEETMHERVHVGASTWIEAPAQLSEFVQGARTDHPSYERVAGSETRLTGPKAAVIGKL